MFVRPALVPSSRILTEVFLSDVKLWPMRVGWIYDRLFREHDTGEHHVERAERLGVILDELHASGLDKRLQPLNFRTASADEIALVHDPAYVELVWRMCDAGFRFIGSRETALCQRSYDVAALAVGGVLAACDAVLAGTVDRAFCAVRPPGHHAESDQALGFCLFNNVAIAAEHLIRNRQLERVAIVDFDVHHGNGTQHIFEARDDVFYISLHERPGSLEFPGSGYAEERGFGPGAGRTLNVPLRRGSNGQDYLRVLAEQVLPALEDFRPQFLLLSAGFDALMRDNVSHVSVEAKEFEPITAELVRAVDGHTAARTVSVLEGGYDLGDLGKAVCAHLRGLLGSLGS
jgi:acetoin utilization deacetylase AcuC-like enzyme